MSEVSEVVQIDTLKRRMVACASLLDQIGVEGVRLLSCWVHPEGFDQMLRQESGLTLSTGQVSM